MLEGEGSSPVRDVGFSLICDTDWRLGCQGFFPGTPVCSTSLRAPSKKNPIPNSVVATGASHNVVVTVYVRCVSECVRST